MLSSSTEIIPSRPKSRAQVLRDKVEIRLAVNEAGPAIATILKMNGVELPGADWGKVFPNWLIATVDDDVIGCCQVLIGRPTGFLEFLFVNPKAPFKFRAIAIRKLLYQGFATLQHAGSQFVCGGVSVRNKKFAEVLEKMNMLNVGHQALMVKRI